MLRGRRAFVLTAGALVAFSTCASAPRPQPDGAARPKLVVMLAVDQMRADYIDLYGRYWTGGLKRLLETGAHFRNARFPYLGTVTCPGHATLGTGAFPASHGMILNAWWDRNRRAVRACTADETAPLVRYTGHSPAPGGESAFNLKLPTLADEMRSQLPRPPRVVSLSMKPRSAISLAGRKADVVVWWDGNGFVTSRAYTEAPMPFVSAHFAAHPPERGLDLVWHKRLDPSAYFFSDDAAEERPPQGWTRVFPHPLRNANPQPPAPGQKPPGPLSLWASSPEADRALARLAATSVDALKLGQGEGIDYLAVSFSVLDSVGHPFGPRSHEVQDVLAHLDATLGELFAHLDARVGRDRYVVALSADHGVATYPEQFVAEGKDAGRVRMDDVKEKLAAALAAVLGPGEHVASYQYTDIYLAPGVLDRLRASPGAIAAALAAIRSVPGVADAFCTDELRDRKAVTDPLRVAAALSHFPERSGDLILVPRANWLTVASGTTHGTHNDYDQRVPVILMGAGIRRGVYDRAVTPADIVPTLAAMVGVRVPHADGKPLGEAVAPR